jgi:GTP-binding protein Era
MISKTCMITICGRPNVGKSTLANAIVGEKIAIVSHKPQTTRNRIYAVKNLEDTQLVFMDTPGFHRPRSKLDEYMDEVVRDSFSGTDAVCLVVEPIPSVGLQEEQLIAWIKASGLPSVLVVNKIDEVKKEELLAVIAAYAAVHDFDHVLPLSAKTGEGVDELLSLLRDLAPEGPALFPEDMVTDQPDSQIVAELVREKLLYCLEHEIPHGTAIEVTKFSEREDSGIIDLDVTIYCEKASHKAIIIGKRGAMIRKIGEMARKDIERYMGTKVFLQTWVKVKENWRDSSAMLRSLGYRNEE